MQSAGRIRGRRPGHAPGRTAASCAAAALLLTVANSPVRAQEPDSVVRLDSLLVEALRLPTAGEAAPYSVSVVETADTRDARAGSGLAEALHGVPGLQASDRNNDALGERLVVRGFGARAGFGVRGLRVLIDGIPATLPDGQTDLSRLDMAAIGRVEVLRGAASALYGNAAGGVLRISSAPPPDAPVAPRAEAVFGADGLWRGHAALGGRTAGGAWYDVTLTRRTIDGFREHSASEKTFVGARAGVAAFGGELRLQAVGLSYDAQNPGSLATAALEEDREQAHAFNVAQRAGETARQALAGATWLGAIGFGRLELTGYGTARTLDNPIPVAIIDLDRAAGGVRAVYGADPSAPGGHAGSRVAFLVGVELDLQRDDRRNFENEGGLRGDRTLDQMESVRALGSFVHARLPLAGRFDASAGLRYDRFRFEVDDRLTDGDPDDSGVRGMSALSPSVGLHAELAPAIHAFANVATAFETPTTTELANRPDGAGGFNPDLEPQRTLSFEAGARARRGPLGFEVAVYHARVRDALLPFEVPGAGGRQFFRNAGSAVHRGLETALRLDGPGGLRIDAAWTWTDARFDRFTVDGTSHDGNRVPGIAPHRIDVGAGWRSARWLAGLEVSRSGAVPVDDANSAESEPWTVVDVRAEWRLLPTSASEIRLFGGIRNLFDEEYVGSVVVNAFGGRYYEPAPGRGVYLGVRAGLH